MTNPDALLLASLSPCVQSGNALHGILSQLRTGISTDPTAAAPEVASHLEALGAGLRTLAAAVEQHSSWARLLTHPSTTGLVAGLETQLAAAQAVLLARRSLWEVVSGWRRFLDRLYALPCIDEDRAKLMSELQEHVGRVKTHASRITVRPPGHDPRHVSIVVAAWWSGLGAGTPAG